MPRFIQLLHPYFSSRSDLEWQNEIVSWIGPILNIDEYQERLLVIWTPLVASWIVIALINVLLVSTKSSYLTIFAAVCVIMLPCFGLLVYSKWAYRPDATMLYQILAWHFFGAAISLVGMLLYKLYDGRRRRRFKSDTKSTHSFPARYDFVIGSLFLIASMYGWWILGDQ